MLHSLNVKRVRELTESSLHASFSFLFYSLFFLPIVSFSFRLGFYGFFFCLLSAHVFDVYRFLVWICHVINHFTFAHLPLELINYTQPVYVWREDPDSRQNTIKEIKRRTTSPDGWQQILIFPEGTCSNRKGLITFKPGAFYPGVPVQPVCIRYPNRLDTLSWTWQGPGAYVHYFQFFKMIILN